MNDKQTILIVDDIKSNIDILINALDAYDLIASLNGKTAIEIVNSEKIDLILLDVMMPDMDGLEVCKILKQNKKTAKIPIIFLTAKNNIDDLTIGFELGAVDYITKPFNPIELLARVKTHLELKSYQDHLEFKVQEEVNKNRIKEQILFQTSKQAEIGELLMHIAHQWKQPLSELGSINMYNTAKLETTHKIEESELLESFEKTSNILDFMSQTVSTFQNYYKVDQESVYFNIIDSINDTLNIIDATFHYFNITINIQENHCPIVYGNSNECAQVILSILNNAKDVLIQRAIEKPEINISIDLIDTKTIVTIEDNAKGIELENIEDVFLPFISNKNSVGIGLYMAKNIIEKNNGTIEVTNTTKGASFKITF